jgi:hypothetical protein
VNSQTWSPEIRGSWLQQHANPPARTAEQQLERAVSTRIGAMPVLVLTVPDRQHRRLIEANAIALLSRRAGGVDPASPGWLGQHAASKQVRDSALWNVEHVDDIYDREFLDLLDDLVCGTSAPSGALEDMHTEVPDTQASRLGDERHYSDQTSWTLQDLILQRHMG